jgi:hypothetical protein
MPIPKAHLELRSAVGENEIIEIMDRKNDSWMVMADTAWVKGYVATLYPGVALNEQEHRLFDDLEKVLEGRKAQMLWAATLLLATKK